MGLIKAIINAGKNVLADQWVDYIKCDALPVNVICQKGEKYIASFPEVADSRKKNAVFAECRGLKQTLPTASS